MVVPNTAGYRRQSTVGSTDRNFVVVDGMGHQVDIHVFHFDSGRRHVYGIEYPRESLQGNGFVDGQQVQCLRRGRCISSRSHTNPPLKIELTSGNSVGYFPSRTPTHSLLLVGWVGGHSTADRNASAMDLRQWPHPRFQWIA